MNKLKENNKAWWESKKNCKDGEAFAKFKKEYKSIWKLMWTIIIITNIVIRERKKGDQWLRHMVKKLMWMITYYILQSDQLQY